MRPQIPLALAAGAVLVLSGCSAGTSSSASTGDDVIRFATLPLGDDPKATTPVAAITDLLEAETGKKVEVTDVPSYSAVIEAIRNGHQDIGIMSGFPSALAVSTGEVDSLIAWPGEEEPVSTCLVLEGSPLKSLNDIDADTVVAFADPASSSGYFMPTHMLHEAGLQADKDYQKLMSGGHDRSFIALENGQADVACTSTIFPSMAGKGDPLFPFDKGETRSIGESISMPISITVLGSKDMSEEKRTALLEAIPQVFAPENADKLGVYAEGIPAGVEPIIEPGKEEFQPFVDIAKIADVDISELE